MQRRKTSVWTPDNDPRSIRQRQESQQPEKESQPQPETQSLPSRSGAAQEPKPHMTGRVAGDKPKPKPEAKPAPQAKPAPDEPKGVTETQAKVKKTKVKKTKVKKATAKEAKVKGDKPKTSSAKAKRKRRARSQRAIDYFDKQIRQKTEMVFIGYGETVDCTIIRGLLYDWVLAVNEERDKRKKTDFCCCYKQKDTEKVKATMITDLAIVNQKLEPIIPRKDRYKVSDEILKTSQASKSPMTVALRTGKVFTGYVDWFTPFDIALILSNGGKVKIFRHGLYDVKVDAPEVKDEE